MIAVTGWGVERFGFRKFILATLCYLTCTSESNCAELDLRALWSNTALTYPVTIFFVAPSIEVLAVGEATCGLAWGVFMSSESDFDLECGSLALTYSRNQLRC